MRWTRRDIVKVGGCQLISILARPIRSLAQDTNDTDRAARVLLTWGTNGHGDGQFDIPIAIVISRRDEILVTDFRQSNEEAMSRVQRFDANGRLLGSFEVDPMPGGLALDNEGLLYATHMMRHKVAVYDEAGAKIREFGEHGAAPGEFDQPGGIVIGLDGSVFVADQVNRRVQRLTTKGEPLGAWGKYGVQPGQFGGKGSPRSRVGGPQFLAVNRQGDLYTTEAAPGRIQKFRQDGAHVLAWGDNDVGPGHFGGNSSLPGPIAIALDAEGNAWVTSTNHTVQQFTPDGKFLRRLGGEGDAPGSFRLPHGLAFDSQNHLYVCDSRNSRIQKIAV